MVVRWSEVYYSLERSSSSLERSKLFAGANLLFKEKDKQ